ncbi:MAG: SMC family ATPase [Acidimicrobiaceae bacterium]|nr:SMC family ATPase [Acidimicrobiaceae bacterium]
MRPLRLSMTGLRSYRRRVEIDFGGTNLLAIVGDTGAGKSSILEAIIYALYKGTSWDRRGQFELIADGVQTMSVELEFRADGQHYRVHRSNSRQNYPPSVNKLECLSDPSIPMIDGENEVNAAIVRLVGMDYNGFTSAVLLPQGEFQRLLQATPADRTKILKGIFRLDEVEAVREQAHNVELQAQELLFALREKRSHLLADPRGEAAAAKDEAVAAGATEDQLRDLEKEVEEHLEQARAARVAKTRLGEPAEQLQKLERTGAELLKGLVQPAVALEAEAERLATQLAQEKWKFEGLTSELEAAAAAGEGLGDLTRFREVLLSVQRDLVHLAEERGRIEAEGTALTAEKDDIAALTSKLTQLEAAANEATSKAKDSERAFADLDETKRRATDLVGELRRDASAIRELKQRLAARRAEAAETERKVGPVRARWEERKAKSVEAQESLVRAVRRGALAKHAHELTPGDQCPICHRELQADFQPPELVDEEPVRQAASSASDDAAAARDELTALEHRLKALETSQQEDQDELQEREASLARRVADELEALIPGDDYEDQNALAPLIDSLAVATLELNAARQAATDAQMRLSTEHAVIERRRSDLAVRETDHRGRIERVSELEERAEHELATLPAAYRPDEKTLTLAASLEKAKSKVEQLNEVVRSRSSAQAQIDRIRGTQAQLQRRRTTEIEGPTQAAIRSTELLKQRVDDLLVQLGKDCTSALPVQADLEEAAQWASEVEGRSLAALAESHAEIKRLDRWADDLEARARELLRQREYSKPEELKEALIRAAGDRYAAERRHQQAVSQIDEAEDLDRRIADGTSLWEDLRELIRLLQDGQFIRHVIDRRQRNLLAIASEILTSMTGGHYGFSDSFMVVDRVSLQPRGPKTLSGGESFLASLALALGLVEIAARSGGRLDALFLDEGFGALDANSLDEAMSALERRAAGGRLVAVVSHIKAVAERIETVLSVTKTPAGSDAVLIKGSERQDLIEEELEAGLLK